MIYGDGTTEGEYGRKEEPIGRGRLAGQKEQHKQYLPKITLMVTAHQVHVIARILNHLGYTGNH